MIEFYKAARDCAWKTLLECKITSLPVDLSAVAHHYGIRIASYSTCPLFQLFEPSAVSGDGFVAQVDDVIIVFVNDKCASRPRRRFTLGHEIGHARLHHRLDVIHTRSAEQDINADPQELQANVFARDLLMPACVLHAIGATTAQDIMRYCDISRASADIRANRLALLQKRNAYETSSLEVQILSQFEVFINEHKK